MTETKLSQMKVALRDGKMVQAAGGITQNRVQSDKLGYDWLQTFVNDVLVRQEYVEQDNPQGTADNPITWSSNTVLIPNAYYAYSGVTKVWFGEAGVTADWTDSNFVLM